MSHQSTATVEPRIARWRHLRRLARGYDRRRFLAAVRPDLFGREIAALAEAARECAAEPTFTRVLIDALRRRRRALLRAGPGGRMARGPLADALAVAIFGELAILRHQRVARAQPAALAHLAGQIGAPPPPA